MSNKFPKVICLKCKHFIGETGSTGCGDDENIWYKTFNCKLEWAGHIIKCRNYEKRE